MSVNALKLHRAHSFSLSRHGFGINGFAVNKSGRLSNGLYCKTLGSLGVR